MLIEDIFRQIVLSLALVAAASAQWPAGVSPAACPNYPYCGEEAAPVAYAAALPADPALRYPAGVSAASCPNYPDCFQGRNSSVSLSSAVFQSPWKHHQFCNNANMRFEHR